MRNLNNDGVFYTDSNGLAMLRREVAAHRAPGSKAYEYKGSVGEECNATENYYPVTSAI